MNRFFFVLIITKLIQIKVNEITSKITGRELIHSEALLANFQTVACEWHDVIHEQKSNP